jgi:stearoyl-CoA desaturase (Delta-9 desaturase)
MYLAICLAVFVAGVFVNTCVITLFYHRGFAHRAIQMKPWLEWFVIHFGNWLTGLDPKGWVCMHRLHHKHSDAKGDPHSPGQDGFFAILYTQLKSYKKILVGLHRRQDPYHSMVADLEFPISWLNRKRVWWMPYAVHAAIGVVIGLVWGYWLLGGAYFLGIMSHPIEGWMVNSFGHARGGRNFDNGDNSRNNHVVAWLIMGEGFQNNHHMYPSSAKFSYRASEIDMGYAVCRVFETLGMLKINREKLIPAPPARAAARDEVPAPVPSVAEL